jgi:hypothetical protein
MSTQVQIRRGTTAECDAMTPAAGELILDTSLNQLRVGDGLTLGGKGLPAVMSVQNSGDTNNSASGSGADYVHSLTYSIPANVLKAGRSLRVTAHFRLTSGSSAPTLAVKLKLGSTVVSENIQSAVGNSLTNNQYAVTWFIQATAAPGAAANVEVAVQSSNNAAANANVHNTTDMPVALATNGALTLAIASQWATAGTGTSTLKLSQLIVESVN